MLRIVKFLLLFVAGVLLASLLHPRLQSHLSLDHLPHHLREWHSIGKLYEILPGRFMFAISDACGAPAHVKDTLILIHGFPSSSFDYHRALTHLCATRAFRVLLFDHLGFGFSDKPKENLTYSIQEHADHAVMMWKEMRRTGELRDGQIHIVAHDMGDSVLAEILTRKYRGLLPCEFTGKHFPTSVTFTNGGMLVNLINFRLSQRLLLNPWLGPLLTSLNQRAPHWLVRRFQYQQLSSIWGKGSGHAQTSKNKDIEDLSLLNTFKNGTSIMHKTIRYLSDRFDFEPRWLAALKELKVPCHLLWGDSDAVSPPVIPQTLHDTVLPQCSLEWIKDTGHFLMLEEPEMWSKHILRYIKSA